MSKFRVGDVCEIVRTDGPYCAHYIGTEVKITMVGVSGWNGPDKHWYVGNRTEPPLLNKSGNPILWRDDELRLKRPKAWDKWLTDTQFVSQESEETA